MILPSLDLHIFLGTFPAEKWTSCHSRRRSVGAAGGWTCAQQFILQFHRGNPRGPRQAAPFGPSGGWFIVVWLVQKKKEKSKMIITYYNMFIKEIIVDHKLMWINWLHWVSVYLQIGDNIGITWTIPRSRVLHSWLHQLWNPSESAAPACSPLDLAWRQKLQAEIGRTYGHSVGKLGKTWWKKCGRMWFL